MRGQVTMQGVNLAGWKQRKGEDSWASDFIGMKHTSKRHKEINAFECH